MAKGKKHTFIAMPTWVFEHEDLARIDLAVYLALAYHADNESRTCYPSHKLLMAETKIATKPTLVNALKRLEMAGAIVINKREGYANLYWLPWERPENRS